MFRSQRIFFLTFLLLALSVSLFSHEALAETDGPDVNEPAQTEEPPAQPPAKPSKRRREKEKEKRKFFVPDNDRVDAGIFYVAAMIGGNFYTEPAVNSITNVGSGNYYKDFGFQAGVNFDYDYSGMTENIPLMLRGFFGYKYILSSTHVFTFDGVVRRMFRMSDKSTFGLGMGGSAAIWYRSVTPTSQNEQILFLPSLILEAGFEFNPVIVDFKALLNQIGDVSTRAGFELYFGIRL